MDVQYLIKGGTIVDQSGQVTVNNPKAAEAIDFFAGLVGKVVPKGVHSPHTSISAPMEDRVGMQTIVAFEWVYVRLPERW